MGVNMKKFLFLISCLVVFGLVSCKKDAIAPIVSAPPP